MSFDLRPYQVEAIDGIRRAWQRSDRVLCTMPTGTGKTVVFLALLDRLTELGELKRGLILVDQEHLVDQPIEKMETFFPHLLPLTQVEQASRRANLEQSLFGHECKIIVATWQSLQSGGNPDRLQRLIDAGGFSHVIVDEAHCNLDAQKRIIERLESIKVVGFTATPKRADKRSLAELYDKTPAYQLLLPDAVRIGALVPFHAYEAILPIKLDGVRKIGDGWDAGQVGELLRASNVMGVVLDKWREACEGRTTIAYTANVQDARDFAEFFSSQGVPAGFVHGGTKPAERDEIKSALEDGHLQIVFNCAVWIKGFDLPKASAIMVIRPTRSPSTLMQMIGRGLRTYPGKDDCNVICFSPIGQPDVVMAGDLINPDLRRAIREASGDRFSQVGIGVSKAGTIEAIDPQQVMLRAIQLLGSSALAWYALPDEQTVWSATVNTEDSLCIILPDAKRLEKALAMKEAGQWNARLENLAEFIGQVRLYHVNGQARLLGEYESFDLAKEAADKAASRFGIDRQLAQRTARWRTQLVTKSRIEDGKRKWGQAETLRYYGVDPRLASNRGEAACLITHAKAAKKAKAADKAKVLEIVS